MKTKKKPAPLARNADKSCLIACWNCWDKSTQTSSGGWEVGGGWMECPICLGEKVVDGNPRQGYIEKDAE